MSHIPAHPRVPAPLRLWRAEETRHGYHRTYRTCTGSSQAKKNNHKRKLRFHGPALSDTFAGLHDGACSKHEKTIEDLKHLAGGRTTSPCFRDPDQVVAQTRPGTPCVHRCLFRCRPFRPGAVMQTKQNLGSDTDQVGHGPGRAVMGRVTGRMRTAREDSTGRIVRTSMNGERIMYFVIYA